MVAKRINKSAPSMSTSKNHPPGIAGAGRRRGLPEVGGGVARGGMKYPQWRGLTQSHPNVGLGAAQHVPKIANVRKADYGGRQGPAAATRAFFLHCTPSRVSRATEVEKGHGILQILAA